MSSPVAPPRLSVLLFGGEPAADDLRRNLAFADRIVEAGGTLPDLRGAGGIPEETLRSAEPGWALCLHAGERVSLELRDAILQAMRSSGDAGPSAFSVTVVHYRYGKYLKHGGWRRRETRLFRAPGQSSTGIGALQPVLVSLGERRIADTLRRLARPAPGVKGSSGRRSRWRLLAGSAGVFCGIYFRRQGFRDGVHGLLAAAMASLESCLAIIRETPGDDDGRAGRPAGKN